jgi:single-strand DNA-binding protein
MASFNRVILLGNLTRDVEVKYLQSGTAVAEVGLAVNDRRKDAKTNQWIDETTFVDVNFWGRTAEIAAEYLSKGSPVLVEGRLKLDQWETEGQKRSKLRVVCERMQMVGSKGGGGSGGGRQGSGGAPQYDESEFGGSHEEHAPRRTAGAQATSSAPPPDDEIPF